MPEVYLRDRVKTMTRDAGLCGEGYEFVVGEEIAVMKVKPASGCLLHRQGLSVEREIRALKIHRFPRWIVERHVVATSVFTTGR